MTDSWIICETAGRWTAALRAQIARQPSVRGQVRTPRRIHEIRHFDDFRTSIAEGRFTLGLLEVRRDNLATTLAYLSSDSRPSLPIVALLHESLQDDAYSGQPSSAAYQFAADALCEAGALTTVYSPRRVAKLFGLTQTLAVAHADSSAKVGTQSTFAEWAGAALPWQDE
jgi:hypothetical protein